MGGYKNSITDIDGKVGINKSNPAVELDVNGATRTTRDGVSSQYIQFESTSGGNFINAAGSGKQLVIANNSSTIQDITFLQSGNEKVRIDSSGNVGIGIQVASSFNQRVNAPHLVVGSGSNSAGVTIYSGTTAQGSINFADGTTTTEQYMGGIIYVHGTDNYMAFNTNGATERMRIDSSGNVGINQSNPASKLHITNASGGSGGYLKVTDAAYVGDVRFGMADGIDNDAHFGTWTNNNVVAFTNGSERMRITSGGDVLIGTQTPITSLGRTLQVKNNSNLAYFQIEGSAGSIVFRNSSNSTVGTITISASATAYNTSSDYRLKENVVAMTGALDRVDALKPSRFNFIADPEKTVDGFLAHEVAEVVPEAVTGEKDAVDEEGNPIYQGIDQSKIVPLLVGAIKELRAEIELLKSQLS